jgi:SAM-dependent methyltransferase
MLSSHEKHVKLFETLFSEINDHIDRSIDPYLDFPYEKALIHNQLDVLEKVLLPTQEGENTFLEIGSGLGQVPPLFSSFGYNAVGGDLFPKPYSPKIWKFLSKKYGCNFVKFDGLHLPFRNESFNTVIFLGVLEYIHNTESCTRQNAVMQFISEIQRVLKSNGKLLMSVPNQYSFFKFPGSLKTIPKGYTNKEISTLLGFCGFKLVIAWRDNFFPFRVRRVSPVLERITTKFFKIYLIADIVISKTVLGVTSTNLHFIFLKKPNPKNKIEIVG